MEENVDPIIAFKIEEFDAEESATVFIEELPEEPAVDGLLSVLEQELKDEEPGTSAQKELKSKRVPTPEELDDEKVATFKELNKDKKNVTWNERYEVIKTQFPSVHRLDWAKVFEADPRIMGRLLNDIIKVDVSPSKGRPGKRPPLERDLAADMYRRFDGQDYSLEPFAKAINVLKGTNSVRQMARKCSMSPSHAYRLIMGHKEPTIEDMELVADAYKKHPSFFHEWRIAFICRLIVERSDIAPEAGIVLYNKVVEAKREIK